MNTQPILQLKNVAKKIGKKTIIDDLSFEVARGEIFGFLGPNGAGKTTTIRMIVGLMSMTGGEILINGISVKKDFEKAMLHIGAIVENPEMYKFLTGYQNLIHFARMNPGISKARIEEVIELVGLKNRIRDKVKKYSLGMRQRLGVAQALLHKPSVLILDEPTNGLDPAGIRELRDYLRRLTREEGISVIVSSHLLSEMELMCDRIAVIQEGQLLDIQKVNDFVQGNTELVTVRFEVDQPIQAKDVIMNRFKELNVRFDSTYIEMEIKTEQIPEINEALHQSELKVFTVSKTARTLEDKFLELTRRDQIG